MKHIEKISSIGQLPINAFYYQDKSNGKKQSARQYVVLFDCNFSEINTYEVSDLAVLESMHKINEKPKSSKFNDKGISRE